MDDEVSAFAKLTLDLDTTTKCFDQVSADHKAEAHACSVPAISLVKLAEVLEEFGQVILWDAYASVSDRYPVSDFNFSFALSIFHALTLIQTGVFLVWYWAWTSPRAEAHIVLCWFK